MARLYWSLPPLHPAVLLQAPCPGHRARLGDWRGYAGVVAGDGGAHPGPGRTDGKIQKAIGTAARSVRFRRACDDDCHSIAQQWPVAAAWRSPWARRYFQQARTRCRSVNHAYRCSSNRLLGLAGKLWQSAHPTTRPATGSNVSYVANQRESIGSPIYCQHIAVIGREENTPKQSIHSSVPKTALSADAGPRPPPKC
jgi:hypothetical protein